MNATESEPTGSVIDLEELREAGYEFVDVTPDGTLTLRAPHTVRAFVITARVE